MAKTNKSSVLIFLAGMFFIALAGCSPRVGDLVDEISNSIESARTPTTAFAPPPVTAQPTFVLPTGWEEFPGPGFSISLPEVYEGGSGEEAKQMAIDLLRAAGNEDMASSVEKSNALLFVVDSNMSRDNVITNMSVYAYQDASFLTMTMPEAVDGIVAQLPLQFALVKSDEFQHPRMVGHRLVFSVDMADLTTSISGKVNSISYLFLNGDTLWHISFSTGSNEFNQRIDDFDFSATTFTIIE